MKKIISLALALLMAQSSFFFALSPINVAAQTQEILNNKSVIEMVKSGYSDQVIISMIKSSKNKFDTSVSGINELKKSGVSDSVILEMVQSAANRTETNADSSSSGEASSVVIPDGTEIKIVTTEDISGQKVVEGDPLTFKVSEDVKIDGKTVIAKDSLVKGTVSAAKKKGFMGKGGELSVRIESTQTVDNQKLKLRASKSGQGGDNMGSTVALTVLFGPLGLLRRGKEAKIKAGTVLTAYTDEAKTVQAK